MLTILAFIACSGAGPDGPDTYSPAESGQIIIVGDGDSKRLCPDGSPYQLLRCQFSDDVEVCEDVTGDYPLRDGCLCWQATGYDAWNCDWEGSDLRSYRLTW